MRKCCFKLNLPLEGAKKRYCDWIDEEIDKSIHISQHENGWTYFVDLEGEAFFGLTNESWMELAMDNSVTYGYYDEDFNAELLVIENGKLIREFSLYEDEPDANENFGSIEYEKSSPIEDWNDVATFLETELNI
ncbi:MULTISPECIES: hypothetical protein [unclassified Lysinibacillus]|uniref:hypothetical protein n=1 Tax=unclassified Lysinibacillus TaxID=2636778 RepID=UPI00255656CF|nr:MULTISPECIES: hypothetical protein [unclassified Lysinibacillus]MDM5247758.1 hypothetical protein [Lysinibacillus sp. G4S2]